MTAKDYIERLKYLVTDRKTRYQNRFPFNCGYYDGNGILSFDCIGMVKSVINDPDIVFNRTYEHYAQPAAVIPDVSEIDILNLCTDIEWNKFQSIVPGEYLYMGGHGAIYVGDIFGSGSGVNVIECTCTSYWPADGVVASWIDLDTGNRYDCKGGKMLGTWEAHGKLTKYINYEKEPKMKWIKGVGWKLTDAEGNILTGWQKVGNKWYSLNSYGVMRSGWYYDPNYKGWFLLNAPEKGEMLTGWQKVGGKWYYLAPKTQGKDICGKMYTGKHTIDGKNYTFDENGVLIS